jgi:TM2 domain-containing membrane protein YozV
MFQKIFLPIVVFVVILVALTFGETVINDAFAWLSYLSGLVLHNFSDIYYAVQDYVARHASRVIVALALTVPISFWIIKNKGQELTRRTSRRKVAIVLAIFLGWLGGHRFYLGQIGWGITYLVIFYIFAPLVILLSLIDAVRYVFMSDEEFTPSLKPTPR